MPLINLKQYPRRSIIKKSGEIDRNLRFILNGAGIVLLISSGKQICTDICFEDDYFTDFESLNTGKPSGSILKNVEPLDVIEIHHQDFMPMYEKNMLAAHMGKVLADTQHMKSKRHLMDNYQGLTSRERFNRLMKENPQVFLRVPQYHIASYLGMSPQTLSRLRKQ